MCEVAERKLRDEIIRARGFDHHSDLFAHRRGPAREREAGFDDCVEIFGQPREAGLRAVFLP